MIRRSERVTTGSVVGDPSVERIRELAAEIRKGWSRKTYARRAAQGAARVEVLRVAFVECRPDAPFEV